MRKITTTLASLITAAVVATPAVASAVATFAPDLPDAVQTQAERLAYSHKVAPGVRVVSIESDSSCTVGWIARDTATGDLGFITAGHCGNEGEKIYLEPTLGEAYGIGTIKWSAYDSSALAGSDKDLMFVSVSDSSLLDTHVSELNSPATGLMDSSTYGRVRPDLCKVGFATGVTCGNSIKGPSSDLANRVYFHSESFEGDSGSPVFARTKDGQLEAVGILTGYAGSDEYRKSVQVITPQTQHELGFEVLF